MEGNLELGTAVATFDRVQANMAEVVAYVARRPEAGLDPARRTGRDAYFRALRHLQRITVPWDPDRPRTLVAAARADREGDVAALRALMDRDDLPPGWELRGASAASMSARVLDGLDLMAAVLPETAATFHLSIGELLLATSANRAGASVSQLIGMIWLSPRDQWTADDIAEALVHELVHQSLFLEELVHSIFSPALRTDPTLVTSAILEARRPYDRAFHSAVVLHALRTASLRSGRSWVDLDATTGPLHRTVEELARNDHFLTEHGRELLDALERSIDAPTAGWPTSAWN